MRRKSLRKNVNQFLIYARKPAKLAGMAAKDKGKAVVPLPISRERASEIVRDISTDSKRWAILIDYKAGSQWRETVNRRQIEMCLCSGYILEDRATVDEHGNFRFRIARVCGGLHVVLNVALESQGILPKLFVLAIDGDKIQT